MGIYGSKVLVSGFGKCGKAIARVFSAMGAHVMVMARRKQARHEAAELGYETVDFNDPAKACFETRMRSAFRAYTVRKPVQKYFMTV